LIVTGELSLALPLKVGAAVLDHVGGEFKITVGAVGSTMKVTGLLFPSGSPTIELFSRATAV
jgi:hypothetical protein